MHCCSGDSLRRVVSILLAGLWLALAAAPANAGGIEPKEATIRLIDEAYVLTAEFAVDLGPRLEEAVTRGLPLYFKLELVLERPRQYWIPEHIATRVVDHKLSYNGLTRQYRIGSGVLQQNFSSLDDALRVLGRVSHLSLGDKSLLREGESYQAMLRLSLDRSQLPKPFQVDALTDRTWQVEAKTLRWTVKP